jgi:hypothetical protein
MKVFLVGLGCLIGLPLIFVFVIVIIALFAVLFGVGGGLLGMFPFGWIDGGTFITVSHPILATTTFIIVLGIPIIALIYSLIAYLAKLKPLNKAVKWVFMGTWLLALILFLCSGFKLTMDWVTLPHSHIHFNGNSTWTTNRDVIAGNGILSEKEYFLTEAIDYVKIDERLTAALQIEQSKTDSSSLLINGDENLVDKVQYEIRDNKLYLSTTDNYFFRSDNNLIIRLRVPDLKGIQMKSIGSILISSAFTGDEFELKLEGAGKFQADSLDIKSLVVRSEGISSIALTGKATKAKFRLEGAGAINALELLSDSVFASVDGIGSIKCNPTEYLKGELNGIGKITYREEPKTRDTGSVGIGKIGKE